LHEWSSIKDVRQQKLTVWTPPCPTSSIRKTPLAPPRPLIHGRPDHIARIVIQNAKIFAICCDLDVRGFMDWGWWGVGLGYVLRNSKKCAIVDVRFIADPRPPNPRLRSSTLVHPPPVFDRTSLMDGPLQFMYSYMLSYFIIVFNFSITIIKFTIITWLKCVVFMVTNALKFRVRKDWSQLLKC